MEKDSELQKLDGTRAMGPVEWLRQCLASLVTP